MFLYKFLYCFETKDISNFESTFFLAEADRANESVLYNAQLIPAAKDDGQISSAK